MNLRDLVHARNIFTDQVHRFVPSEPRSSTVFLALMSNDSYWLVLTYQISHDGKICVLYIWDILP